MPMHNLSNKEVRQDAGNDFSKHSNDSSLSFADEVYGNLGPKVGQQEQVRYNKVATDISNAIQTDNIESAKKLMQEAMEKGELKEVLELTNNFLGAQGASERLFSVDTVEKVTYSEDRGTHSLNPKSVEFENPQSTVALIDVESGDVETIGTLKNDPIHKGYDLKDN